MELWCPWRKGKQVDLKWPLLEIEASAFGVPLRAASCCSRALDSKYSSHAAASLHSAEQKLSIAIILLYSLLVHVFSFTTSNHFFFHDILPFQSKKKKRNWRASIVSAYNSDIKIPVSANLQIQVLSAVSVEWSAHAARSRSMLPLKTRQWRLHGSWLQSVQRKYQQLDELSSAEQHDHTITRMSSHHYLFMQETLEVCNSIILNS